MKHKYDLIGVVAMGLVAAGIVYAGIRHVEDDLTNRAQQWRSESITSIENLTALDIMDACNPEQARAQVDNARALYGSVAALSDTLVARYDNNLTLIDFAKRQKLLRTQAKISEATALRMVQARSAVDSMNALATHPQFATEAIQRRIEFYGRNCKPRRGLRLLEEIAAKSQDN